jgi:hypothetical protein
VPVWSWLIDLGGRTPTIDIAFLDGVSVINEDLPVRHLIVIRSDFDEAQPLESAVPRTTPGPTVLRPTVPMTANRGRILDYMKACA